MYVDGIDCRFMNYSMSGQYDDVWAYLSKRQIYIIRVILHAASRHVSLVWDILESVLSPNSPRM